MLPPVTSSAQSLSGQTGLPGHSPAAERHVADQARSTPPQLVKTEDRGPARANGATGRWTLLRDMRHCQQGRYSSKVQQRSLTAANMNYRPHPALAGTTDRHPAAPLVRDGEPAGSIRPPRADHSTDSSFRI